MEDRLSASAPETLPVPQSGPRAPYAARPAHPHGRRLYPEAPSPTRSEFQRDRDRVVHTTAFRRLAHKTQVFVPLQGDHYRTRLTHTIEVAQIARSLARALLLDDDLAEALALAHDLGHTPFGHSGEDVLNAMLSPFGGFDHNAHALRIVTELERRYAGFDGLNLTWDMLEGLVKHNGPLLDPSGAPTPRHARHGVHAAILAYDARHPLGLATHASAEAQVAALADDIAYDAHDIDDGLRAGLFTLDDLREVAFLRSLLDEIEARHPGLSTGRRINELQRRVITRFVEDVILESRKRLDGLVDADSVRVLERPVIAFSPAMEEADRAIKGFLYPRMYRHPKVMAVRALADDLVRDLFRRFMAAPQDMPAEWRPGARADEAQLARQVGDYIAGMTDRFALAEHRRLFASTPDLG